MQTPPQGELFRLPFFLSVSSIFSIDAQLVEGEWEIKSCVSTPLNQLYDGSYSYRKVVRIPCNVRQAMIQCEW